MVEKDLLDPHGQAGVDVLIVGALEHFISSHLAPCFVHFIALLQGHHVGDKSDDDPRCHPELFRRITVDAVGVETDPYFGIGFPGFFKDLIGKIEITVGQVAVPLLPGRCRRIKSTAFFAFAVAAPVIFADVYHLGTGGAFFPVADDLVDKGTAGGTHLDGVRAFGIPGGALAVDEGKVLRMGFSVTFPPGGEGVSVGVVDISSHAHLFQPAAGVEILIGEILFGVFAVKFREETVFLHFLIFGAQA